MYSRPEENVLPLNKTKSLNYSRCYNNYENKCKNWIRDARKVQKSVLTLPTKSNHSVLNNETLYQELECDIKMQSVKKDQGKAGNASIIRDKYKYDVKKKIACNNELKKYNTNKNSVTKCDNIWALLKRVNPHPFKDTPVISNENSVDANETNQTFNKHSSIKNNINIKQNVKVPRLNSNNESNRFLKNGNNIKNNGLSKDSSKEKGETGVEFNCIQKKVCTVLNPDKIQNQSKLRLVTTLPSTNKTSTKADIRRKLMQLKFPITVLGRDELSSKYVIEEYEPTQFRGLENQVWPFMIDWLKPNKISKKNNLKKGVFRNLSSTKRNNVLNKQPIFEEKKADVGKTKITNQLVNEDSDNKMLDTQMEGHGKSLNVLYAKTNYKTECKKQSRLEKKPVPQARNESENAKAVVSITTQIPNIKVKPENIKNFISNFINDLDKGTYYIRNASGAAKRNKLENSLCDNKTRTKTTDLKHVFNGKLTKIEKDKNFYKYDPIDLFFNGNCNVMIKELNNNEVIVKNCNKNSLFKFNINKTCIEERRNIEEDCKFPFELSSDFYKCKHLLSNPILPQQVCTLIPKIENMVANK